MADKLDDLYINLGIRDDGVTQFLDKLNQKLKTAGQQLNSLPALGRYAAKKAIQDLKDIPAAIQESMGKLRSEADKLARDIQSGMARGLDTSKLEDSLNRLKAQAQEADKFFRNKLRGGIDIGKLDKADISNILMSPSKSFIADAKRAHTEFANENKKIISEQDKAIKKMKDNLVSLDEDIQRIGDRKRNAGLYGITDVSGLERANQLLRDQKTLIENILNIQGPAKYKAAIDNSASVQIGQSLALDASKKYIREYDKEVRRVESLRNKSRNKEENDEAKAETYYVTRKQRVDDAIYASSKRKADALYMANAMSKSNLDNAQSYVALLRTVVNEEARWQKRLSDAKKQYEDAQKSGGKLSGTYLGRYTGMSELFGEVRNKQTGTVEMPSYNYTRNLTKEAIRSANEAMQAERAAEKAQSKADEQALRDEYKAQQDANKALDRHNALLEKGRALRLDIIGLQGRMQNMDKSGDKSMRGLLTGGSSYTYLARMKNDLRRAMNDPNITNEDLEKKIRNAELAIKGARVQTQQWSFDNRQAKADVREHTRSVNEESAALNRAKSLLKDARTQSRRILNALATTSPLTSGYSNASTSMDNIDKLRTELRALVNATDKDVPAIKAKMAELRLAMKQGIGDVTMMNGNKQINNIHETEAKRLEDAMHNASMLQARLNRLEESWKSRLQFSKTSTGEGISRTQVNTLQRLQSELSAAMKSGKTEDISAKVREIQVALGGVNVAAEQYSRLQREAAESTKSAAQAQKDMLAAARENASAISSLASSFSSLRNNSKGMSRAMSDIKTLALQGGGIYMAKNIFDQIVQQGGQIEQQHIALRSMIGDYQEADKLFNQIKMLAIESPFTFSEMVRNTKQLVAYGIEEDKVYDTTKRLSDISAGLGVSVERLALAFGQVKARGWLDAKELRQFAYAGLPLTSKLSAYYTKEEGKDVSPADVMKMIKKRQVAFTDVQKVLWQLTDKGGQFYNMQSVLTDTLLGKFNKLKDAWDIMLSDFTNGGNVVGSVFKGILDITADLIQNMNKIAPLLVGFGTMYGIRKLGNFGISKLGLTSAKSLEATARRAMMIEMQKYAAMQQERVLSGEISMYSARTLINKRLQTMQTSIQNGDLMRMLALQGQLKPMELASWMSNNNKTLTQKKQNIELLRQLELMGMINKEEARSIYANNRRALAMQQAKSWAGGLFTKGNLAMVGLSIAAAGFSRYEEITEQNKQAAEEMAESMKNSIKSVEDAIAAHGDKPLTAKYIGSLEEVLRQSDLYSNSLGDQIAKATKLGEKYEIIKEKIREARFVQEHGDLLGNMSDAATMGLGIKDRINGGQFIGTAALSGIWGKFIGILRGFNGYDMKGLISSIHESEVKLNDLGNHGVKDVKAVRREVANLRSTWEFMARKSLPSVMKTMEREVNGFGRSWRNMNIQARNDFKNTIYSWIDSMGESGTEIGAHMFAIMMMMKTAPDAMKDPKNMVWRKGSKSALSVWGHYYYDHYARHYVPKTKEYNPGDADSGKKKKNKHTRGEKTDPEAEALKRKAELLKKYYEYYKKYYDLLHNEGAALKKLEETYGQEIKRVFPKLSFENLVQYDARLQDLRKEAEGMYKTKKHHNKYVLGALNEIVDAQTDRKYTTDKESMSDYSSKMAYDLKGMERRWNTYQQIWKVTGNPDLAAASAGLNNDSNMRDYDIMPNGSARSGYAKEYSQYLSNYLNDIILKSGNPDKSIDYKAVLKMDDKEIEKYSGELFKDEKDNNKIEAFVTALKKYRDLVTDTEFQQGINTYMELMKQIVDTQSEVNRSQQEYISRLNDLDTLLKNGAITKEQYDKGKEIAATDKETKQLHATTSYQQYMNDVTSMTESAAKSMRDTIFENLAKRFKEGSLTVNQYVDSIKQVNEQMEAFNNHHGDAYAFATGGLQGWANNQKQKGYDELYADLAKNGGKKYFDPKTQMPNAAGMAMLGKAGGAASTVAIVDTIVNGINSNVQSYKNLEKTWTDAFGDGLKNSKFSEFMGGFTEASQGAADAWNSLKSGNFVGVFDGVVRSFTGWFSFGNAAANRRWKEQAEYLKGFQATLNKINSNLESKISPSYGSQAITSAKEYKENLSQEASEIRKTAYNWSQAHSIHKNHRNRMYVFGSKGDTRSAFSEINATLRANGYTGPDVGGDNIQDLKAKWLEMIRDKHAGLWGKMDSDLQGYLDRLIEIGSETGDVEKATKKLAETLSGLSVDGLQSDYESLIESFEATNTDFADDFEKKLKKAILSGMIANLYKDRIKSLVDESVKIGTNATYLSSDGTIKQHAVGSNGEILGKEKDVASEYTPDEYEKMKESAVSIGNDINSTAKMLQEAFGWSSGSANSTSSSIKGMTEQTADLLASYLNAIRADVSVIRQLSIPDLDTINVTAKSQLQQLNQIARNTALNAEIAGRMEASVSNMNGILESVKNGTKSLAVKVQ